MKQHNTLDRRQIVVYGISRPGFYSPNETIINGAVTHTFKDHKYSYIEFDNFEDFIMCVLTMNSLYYKSVWLEHYKIADHGGVINYDVLKNSWSVSTCHVNYQTKTITHITY